MHSELYNPGVEDNAVQTFNFNGLALRALSVDGEPWFIAKDVAEVLGYRMASDMTRRLDEDEKGTRSVRTPGGEQNLTIISEPGLYEAILGSQVSGAKVFKRWVKNDVLPAIRKTGSYGGQVELTGEQLLSKALMHAQTVMAQKDQTIHHQAVQLEAARPAVEYVEHCVAADDVLLMKDWGFEFGLTGLAAYDLLVERGIVYRKFIGERWSNKLMRKVKEYEYRPKPGVTDNWFSLRAQHKAARHHNGQVRQTLYVKAIHSVDLAKRVGLISNNEIVEAA